MSTTPLNISVAHPTRFRLSFPFLPFLSETEKGDGLLLYCSDVELPELSMEPDKIATPYYPIKMAKGDFECSNITVKYSVDELFANYRFLYNWFMYQKNPERYKVNNEYVDAALHIFTNNGNIKFHFTLKNIFPIKLSPIQFSTKTMDGKDLTHECVFSLDYFKMETIE